MIFGRFGVKNDQKSPEISTFSKIRHSIFSRNTES